MNTDGFHVIATDTGGTPHDIHSPEPEDFWGLIRNWKYASKTRSACDISAIWKKSDDECFVLVSGEGNLFDPLDSSNNINKRDGRFWKFKQCSKECYRQYTTFLKSKSRTPYLVAQRRFRNDFGKT